MKSSLYYTKHGSGQDSLILFHGFGQNNEVFNDWLEHLEKGFTTYSFDIYYHGKSTRKDEVLFINEWKENFQSFLELEKIHDFSIGSFSLGGRFAIATTLCFPTRIRQLLLVAPDGIFRSFWFNIATSKIGNPLFKFLMLHPSRFNQLLSLVENLGLATSQMIRFAQKELAIKDNRKRVYRTWTYFKGLQPDLREFTDTVNKHEIKINLILGSKDQIIPGEAVQSKLRRIVTLNTIILEVKHHHLIDASKTLIPSLLKGGNL